MGTVKYILRTIWALWVGVWFALVVLVFTPIYAIILGMFGRKYAMHLIWINCHYLSPFLLAMGLVRYRVHGIENIDTKGTYVHVANHTTAIDILLTASAMPQPGVPVRAACLRCAATKPPSCWNTGKLSGDWSMSAWRRARTRSTARGLPRITKARG